MSMPQELSAGLLIALAGAAGTVLGLMPGAGARTRCVGFNGGVASMLAGGLLALVPAFQP